MTQQRERPLTLACVADQSATAAALREALGTLFPGATIVPVDTGVERVLPDSIDCAVVDATVNGADGIDVLRRLRAGGYSRAAVVVVDTNRPPSTADETSAVRIGGFLCPIKGDSLTPLSMAVADALRSYDGGEEGPGASQAIRALRQTQRLLAAGEIAMRLQHSLNNPLAALLAESQLLELEALPADHRESVQRIIELTRRVIEVVRGLDGVGRA